jgi:hypothetical protein
MALPQQSQNASVTLADLLSNRFVPVQETLLAMLDVRDQARLKRVSKTSIALSRYAAIGTTSSQSFSRIPKTFAPSKRGSMVF